jgi:hemoglobin
MLKDPIVSPFFTKTDMKKQVQSQKSFITMVCGGPNNYHGKDMKAAHDKMNIGKKEFDATWHNLEQALQYYKVPATETKELKEIFYSV